MPVPLLSEAAIREWFAANVPQKEFAGKRVLLIVPDQTRTAPLPLLFETLAERLLPVRDTESAPVENGKSQEPASSTHS